MRWSRPTELAPRGATDPPAVKQGRDIAMNQTSLSALIWSVADLLRGDYKQSEYGRVILPFTVLRRLDCVLEATKAKVLAEKAKREAAGIRCSRLCSARSIRCFTPRRSSVVVRRAVRRSRGSSWTNPTCS